MINSTFFERKIGLLETIIPTNVYRKINDPMEAKEKREKKSYKQKQPQDQ